MAKIKAHMVFEPENLKFFDEWAAACGHSRSELMGVVISGIKTALSYSHEKKDGGTE